MSLLSSELVEFLKSRKPGNFFLGETETENNSRKDERLAPPPAVRRTEFFRQNIAAEERRDPISFYDKSAAISSFQFARETRQISQPKNSIH